MQNSLEWIKLKGEHDFHENKLEKKKNWTNKVILRKTKEVLNTWRNAMYLRAGWLTTVNMPSFLKHV